MEWGGEHDSDSGFFHNVYSLFFFSVSPLHRTLAARTKTVVWLPLFLYPFSPFFDLPALFFPFILSISLLFFRGSDVFATFSYQRLICSVSAIFSLSLLILVSIQFSLLPLKPVKLAGCIHQIYTYCMNVCEREGSDRMRLRGGRNNKKRWNREWTHTYLSRLECEERTGSKSSERTWITYRQWNLIPLPFTVCRERGIDPKSLIQTHKWRNIECKPASRKRKGREEWRDNSEKNKMNEAAVKVVLYEH